MATLQLSREPQDSTIKPPLQYPYTTYPNPPKPYASSIQTPPQSPQIYTPTRPSLPPATDKLIGRNLDDGNGSGSLAARLHRRKKNYKPPTAPPTHVSGPHDPLRAARLAWRLQEEYAEQLRIEEEQMRIQQQSMKGKRREYARGPSVAGAGTTSSRRSAGRRKQVKNRWQAFWLWVSLGWYRFTRSVRSVFK